MLPVRWSRPTRPKCLQKERNLNLVLQILEITQNAILCLNLMDEAERNNLEIDVRTLSKDLGIPVIPTSARYKRGIPELLQTISEMANGQIQVRPHQIKRVPPNIEKAVDRLSKEIKKEFPKVPNSRWLAFRLLEGDPQIIQALKTGVFA